MKKIYLLAFFFLTLYSIQAQEKVEPTKKKGFQKENLFFGGNFGFTIGSNVLSINISPQIGYRFNTIIAAGGGINFQYNSVKLYDFAVNQDSKLSQTILGLNIFGRVYPFKFLFLQAQPEFNYVFGKVKYYATNETVKLPTVGVPSLLLGVGGILSSGGSGGLTIGIFYDVLQDKNSPYGQRPIYNIGYSFGL